MTPGRIWRRTTIERHGRLVPLPDDWSLIDAASGLAIARIHAEPGGGWRCVCRSIIEGELKDGITARFNTGKEAKVYAEAQTCGKHYVVQRKRTKAEILRRAAGNLETSGMSRWPMCSIILSTLTTRFDVVRPQATSAHSSNLAFSKTSCILS